MLGDAVPAARVEELASLALGSAGIRDGHVAIEFVDADRIAELNLEHRGKTGPTDVLSFPMDELRPTRDDEEPEPGLLGDVVLCPVVAEAQAKTAGHSTEDELQLLCTHGMLHLLGYDHGEPAEEKEMFDEQRRLLSAWQHRRADGGRA